jgi:hypothetical protein
VKRKDVDQYEKLVSQFKSVYEEIAILSKKAPNDAINTFKLRFINSLLGEANQLLGKRYVPFDHFSEFEEDDVPSNSDVVFILTQYIECFEKFRSDNIQLTRGAWYWLLEDDEEIKTVPPKRLGRLR